MQKIRPFLMFSEGAVEAMEYYTSIFPNSRIVSTLPGPDGKPAGGTIEIDGEQILAYNGGPHFNFSEGLSLFVRADTQEEIDHLYDSLAEGGEKGPCSWVKDKFGVSWQIVPPILMELIGHEDKEKAGRAMEAMMKMYKIDIQALKDAAGEP
jgi:predicted 3-demethylubiquinone-9 3-methyltransferase (glyoxalase superfamily)